MHRRDIAVSQENLWIPANQVVIDTGEKLPGSVPSPDADDTLHFGILEHRMKIVQALGNGSYSSSVLRFDVLGPFRFQPEVFDSFQR